MPNTKEPKPPATLEIHPNSEAEPAIVFARFDEGQPYLPPKRAYDGDAGLDLYVSRYVVIYPRTSARLPHNLVLALPPRYYAQIVPRSSALMDNGLIVITGTIDPGYRGEVQTLVYNTRATAVTINEGTRVSQLLLHRSYAFPLVETPRADLLKDFPSPRGERGFGSSNRPGTKG